MARSDRPAIRSRTESSGDRRTSGCLAPHGEEVCGTGAWSLSSPDGWVDAMNTDEEKVREIIASQAGEWVAAHQAGPLDAAERRAFYAWLTASPVHVEEYLGVALLSRRLPIAAADPELPVEAILSRVRQETEAPTRIGNAPYSSRAAPRARP